MCSRAEACQNMLKDSFCDVFCQSKAKFLFLTKFGKGINDDQLTKYYSGRLGKLIRFHPSWHMTFIQSRINVDVT